MKVKTKTSPAEFTPIEITLTIESEQELCDLWLRTNLADESIDRASTYNLKYKASGSRDFWIELEHFVTKLNLYK